MFWIDTIWDETHFCTCENSWLFLKFVHATVKCDILKVYMMAEEGKRCRILTLNRGQDIPTHIGELRITPYEHIKIEVKGGEITIVGWLKDGTAKRPSSNFFPRSCPFAGEEEWNRKPIKMQEIKEDKENCNSEAQHEMKIS